MKDIQKIFIYDNGIKIKLIVSFIFLLVLALGFNTLLSLSSLEDIYVGSTFSKYSAIGNDLKRNIEKSLKFGKILDNFVGLNTLLKETRFHLTKKNQFNFFKKVELIKANSGLSVSLALPDNRIYYSTESTLIHQQLPLEVSGYFSTLFTPHGSGGDIGKNYYKFDHEFYIGLPIEKHKRWMGTLIIIFPEDQFKAFTHALLLEKLKLTGMILLGVLVVLLGFLFLVIPRAPGQTRLSKKKIFGVILVFFLLAQIFFLLLNTISFKNTYLEITRKKTAVLGSLLREDIEFILSKGIALDRLSMMEYMLGEIIKVSPELSDITLLDSAMYPLYEADKNNVFAFKEEQRGPLSSVHTPQRIKDSEYHQNIVFYRNNASEADVPADIAGYISITISKEVLLSELMEIIRDAIIVLVISLLFYMELLVIVFQYFAKEMAVTGKIFRVH